LTCVMTHKGEIVTLEEFFLALQGYDITFVGEIHSLREAHQAELIILTELAKQNPSLVLALEMFECDVQNILDAYLKGEISEKRFLKQSRPWPNYEEDYRPLIEFAKERPIPVIAANVPRRAAAAVARANEVSPEVMGDNRIYLPKSVHFNSKEYHQRFIASMDQMPRMAPMKGINVDGLYKAQVLKDAVMAASIEPFLDRPILFCCGHFHSDYHLGIPFQLQEKHSGLRIAVITFASYVGDLPMKERSKIGDFIWIEE
jgi:uncharacterized iron-regulated protein